MVAARFTCTIRETYPEMVLMIVNKQGDIMRTSAVRHPPGTLACLFAFSKAWTICIHTSGNNSTIEEIAKKFIQPVPESCMGCYYCCRSGSSVGTRRPLGVLLAIPTIFSSLIPGQ